jgi:DNA-binding GntR family transcriptional regulator
MEKLRETGGLLTKVPSHEITYCRLRDMILFGQLTPGQAVTIQGLAAMLGAGMTPVREAIRRLTAEGALALQGNRRVMVPVLSRSQIEELAFARMTIEPKIAQMAAERLTSQDVAALAKIDDEIDAAIAAGDVNGYLKGNFRFHFALYERADAPILVALTHTLWLRFGPSLRVVCGRFGTLNLPDRHEEALTAMRARNGTALAQAVENDIAQGVEQIRLSLDSA